MQLDNTIVLGVGSSLADSDGLLWLGEWTGRALAQERDVLLVVSAGPRAEAALAKVAAGMAGTGDPVPRARLHGLGPIEQAERVRQRLAPLGGVRLLDPHVVGPVTRGAPLAATPRRLHTRVLLKHMAGARVGVLPGGVGVDLAGDPSWMGDDGTALAAVFIAGTLGLPVALAGMPDSTPRRAALLARRLGVEIGSPEHDAVVVVQAGATRGGSRRQALGLGLSA